MLLIPPSIPTSTLPPFFFFSFPLFLSFPFLLSSSSPPPNPDPKFPFPFPFPFPFRESVEDCVCVVSQSHPISSHPISSLQVWQRGFFCGRVILVLGIYLCVCVCVCVYVIFKLGGEEWCSRTRTGMVRFGYVEIWVCGDYLGMWRFTQGISILP